MSITNNILAIIRKTINENNMFNFGDTVVLGVSGGADSVMLLHSLNSLKSEYDLNLKVAHINHKIRKGDAEKDADFVKNMCEKMGIEFHLKEAYIKDLAKEWGLGEEEAGRKVRYGFFAELAGDGGKIATAHNANDNVETVLMRLMRGTGVTGLAGIAYKRDNIVRPILGISREDIESYLEENKLTHITDKTNLESIYTRNKIRLELLPFMKSTFNPNLINTITDSIVTFREDADYFEKESVRAYSSMMYRDENSESLKLERAGFYNLHPAIAKRVIIEAIKEVKNVEQIDVSASRIDTIYNGISSKVGTVFTLNDKYRVRIDYDYLVFEKEVELQLFEDSYNYVLSDRSEYVDFSELNLSLMFIPVFETEIRNDKNVLYLPFEEYKDKTIAIRTRKDGDVFRVSDTSHKKLNRMFTDKKVCSSIRDTVPCVCIDNEVLWAVNQFATKFENRKGVFFKISVC